MSESPIPIVFEDNHLLIVNKPSGILSQGDHTGDEDLVGILKSFIKIRDEKPGNVFLGLCHRLDRPSTGLVVLAKTSKALSRTNKLFSDRKIEKQYHIISNKSISNKSGSLEHYLVKDHKTNTSKAYSSPTTGAKIAKLSYQLKDQKDGFNLFEITPVTGRSHQIRVQMSTIGVPVYGDLRYGHKPSMPDASICLHCRSLRFIHPVRKEEIYLEAKYPNILPWILFK